MVNSSSGAWAYKYMAPLKKVSTPPDGFLVRKALVMEETDNPVYVDSDPLTSDTESDVQEQIIKVTLFEFV